MGKRGHNELRSSQVPLTVHKYDLSRLKPSAHEHWNLHSLQPYFPPIEKLFKTSEIEDISLYGIRFFDEISSVIDKNTIRTIHGNTIKIHRKVSMIPSPYNWMKGLYGSIGLPSTTEQSQEMVTKIQSSNNAAYVGSIISAALSQTACIHFPQVYGVFNGISNHILDISDDYAELSDRPWFSQNIGNLFDVEISSEVQASSDFKHTRTARIPIKLGETTSIGDIINVDSIEVDNSEMGDITQVLHDETEDDNESDTSSVSTSYIFNIESCKCSEVHETESEVESFAWASFEKVPVQVTVIEECSGTFYDLIMKHSETEKHLAWVTQLMFALAYAQKVIGLTHNDLHANNVMYLETDREFLYYNCGGVLYKVPTYGYVIKVIDFERSIASIKLPGMKSPKVFMSDQYHIDEEAGGQYNCGDYYISKYPEIKPNPSFDLVRFATSIFWDLFPEGPDCSEYLSNPLFKLFMRWLTLEDGRSILFSKLDNMHDRFHGFHLYKAIARLCKDNAVPRKEVIEVREFYETQDIPINTSVLLIEA